MVVLDEAQYFMLSAVTDLAARDVTSVFAGTQSSRRVLETVTISSQKPVFDSLTELTTAIDTALDQLSIAKVSNYF